MSRPLAIGFVCALVLLSALAPASAALTPAQETAARKLIGDFTAAEFAARQAAVDKLIAMGPDVLPLVQKTLASTTDAEVKLRCNMVVKALTRKPPRPVVSTRLEEKVIVNLGLQAYDRAHWWRRSRDGSHRIFSFEKDGKQIVGHNDWESPPYDEIKMVTQSETGDGLIFWAKRDGKKFMVVNRVEGPVYELAGMPALSCDGTRSLYSGIRGGQGYVVLDGKELPPYERLEAVVGFSRDGRHAAWQPRRNGKAFVVIDGVEGPPHDAIWPTTTPAEEGETSLRPNLQRYFVGDGGQVALVEYAWPKPGDKTLAERKLRDAGKFPNRGGGLSDAMVCYSLDGKRLLLFLPPQRTAYLDGRKIGRYEDLGKITQSADGEHIGFMAKREGKWLCVWDGREGSEDDETGPLAVWSAATGPAVYCYVGRRGDRLHCVVNGRESEAYDAIRWMSGSKDGRHAAFSGKRRDEAEVVLDGRVIAKHEDATEITFDPAGQRLAYVATIAGRRHLVVDGRRGQAFENIVHGPFFSKDGRHIYFAVKQNGKHFVVVDGITGPLHGGGIELLPRYHSPDVLRFVNIDDQEQENLIEMKWPEGVDWTNGLEEID